MVKAKTEVVAGARAMAEAMAIAEAEVTAGLP